MLAATLGNDGLLYVDVTNQDDQIIVSRENEKVGRKTIHFIHVNIENDRNGKTTEVFEVNDVKSIVVDGQAGDDHIEVLVSSRNHSTQRSIGAPRNGLIKAGTYGVDRPNRDNVHVGVVLIGSQFFLWASPTV